MAEEKEQIIKDQEDESVVELESHLIMRLPPTPAAALRAAVRSGVLNLKDRLSIEIEQPEMRRGTVKFDKWSLTGKIVDLPTIVESYKTLDCKTFYKTADLSQVMICKEEEEEGVKNEEEELPRKKDTKDKRHLQLHGVTPPLKNVRRRRFRKTLKKKYVDLPDIEKEVKRLFRMDNEAISVRYEVVNAEDEKNNPKADISDENIMPLDVSKTLNDSQSLDVAEYDIFGEVLSSSDGENNFESELGDNSQMSVEMTSSKVSETVKPLIEFSKGILNSPGHKQAAADTRDCIDNDNVAISQLESKTAGENLGQILKEHRPEEEKTILLEKLDELEHEIAELLARRRAQELEIMSIENQALKQRFQNVIDTLKQQEYEKQREYDEIVTILHDT